VEDRADDEVRGGRRGGDPSGWERHRSRHVDIVPAQLP
jgi:hypothetical protein